VWQHYKGKNYVVRSVGTHTETNEKLVVYTDDDVNVWVRPLSMWHEIITLDSRGKPITRFTEL
jgi:hypothetical protein